MAQAWTAPTGESYLARFAFGRFGFAAEGLACFGFPGFDFACFGSARFGLACFGLACFADDALAAFSAIRAFTIFCTTEAGKGRSG